MAYDEVHAARYDQTHAARFAEAAAVVDEIGSILPPSGGRVLELGVGTGRLAIPLAALTGVEVWGIDSSDAMLAQLARKPGGERVHVAAGDFTVADELVAGPFDLVFVAFNTLFELTDQEAQLRCVAGAARLLAPAGQFLVEAIAPDLTRLEQTLSTLSLSAAHLTFQGTRHDPTTQVVEGADVTVAADGTVSLSPWTIRYVSVAELDLMARLAGLRLKERTGSWFGEPFSAWSPVHVSVYKRA